MEIDIKKVARLGALTLTDEEAKQFEEQLPNIFQHFEKISSIDTDNVEPLVTPSEITYVLRADVVEKWESPEVALANAPEKSGNLFKVPPVV